VAFVCSWIVNVRACFAMKLQWC